MANAATLKSSSDTSSQDSLCSFDYGCLECALSGNDNMTIAKSSVLKGERISFDTSVPTTATLSDGDEPSSSPFAAMMSPQRYFSSEDISLTKSNWPKPIYYNSYDSNGKPHQTSVKNISTEEEECQAKKCSNLQTLMNAYKGNSGPGALSLPLAFRNAGLWVGLSGFLVIAAVAIHSMHILNRCTEYLEQRFGVLVTSYPEAVGAIFRECAPPRLKKYSEFMRFLVNILIQSMQCGFCCVYIVFIATNIKEIVDQLWEGSPSTVVYELMVFIFLVPYLMVRSLKTLAFFSCIGNVLFIAGLIIVYQYMLQDMPSVHRLPAFSSFSSLPLFLGNSLFSFEGVSLVVPLRTKMKEPETFGGPFGVLNVAMIFHAALCTAMGFYGYLRFGEDTASTVSLNLPRGKPLYQSVDVMFSLVVFLSIAVQFYVPITSIWSSMEKRLKCHDFFSSSEWSLDLAQNITRFLLGFVIFLVAVLVPHIDILISLVGAFMGGLLTMVIPGILDMILQHFKGKLSAISIIKNMAVIFVGLCILVTGTYASVLEIIHTF